MTHETPKAYIAHLQTDTADKIQGLRTAEASNTAAAAKLEIAYPVIVAHLARNRIIVHGITNIYGGCSYSDKGYSEGYLLAALKATSSKCYVKGSEAAYDWSKRVEGSLKGTVSDDVRINLNPYSFVDEVGIHDVIVEIAVKV